jgi:hypothetical protein
VAIARKKLRKWNDIHQYALPRWLFRGQSPASSDMKTSIERCFERERIPAGQRSTLETELLREFKRAYHQFAYHVPTPGHTLEWLSVMQHHGAPTRLLDFTYSIYVAAYFALETADMDCAVLAVYGPWLSRESIRKLGKAGKRNVGKLKVLTSEEQEKVIDQCFFSPPFVRTASPLNPFRLNERLRIQKGVFVIPGDPTIGFMDNLQALSGYDSAEHIVQIIIPVTMRREALQQLYNMNISRTSLFPGLDGYARSLGVYHPAFDPRPWI